MAVPAAIGVAGVILIVVDRTVGTTGQVLPAVVAVVLVSWIVCAVLVFRSYGPNLLNTLRHRQLVPGSCRWSTPGR